MLVFFNLYKYFDGLVEERRNSIANALELRLSFTNPSISPLPEVIIRLFLLIGWLNTDRLSPVEASDKRQPNDNLLFFIVSNLLQTIYQSGCLLER